MKGIGKNVHQACFVKKRVQFMKKIQSDGLNLILLLIFFDPYIFIT